MSRGIQTYSKRSGSSRVAYSAVDYTSHIKYTREHITNKDGREHTMIARCGDGEGNRTNDSPDSILGGPKIMKGELNRRINYFRPQDKRLESWEST